MAVGGAANITGVGGPALFASNPTGNKWFAVAYEVSATGGAWRLSSLVVCARMS